MVLPSKTSISAPIQGILQATEWVTNKWLFLSFLLSTMQMNISKSVLFLITWNGNNNADFGVRVNFMKWYFS